MHRMATQILLQVKSKRLSLSDDFFTANEIVILKHLFVVASRLSVYGAMHIVQILNKVPQGFRIFS